MDNEYKNNFNKIHYDRINLTVPKGAKAELKTFAVAKGMSVNEYIWNVIQKNMHTNERLNTFDISSRRYVGSKRSLLPFIKSALKGIRFSSFADLFAGTGVVADSFNNRKRIVTNDILYSNYICHYAWFGEKEYDEKKVRDILLQYNSLIVSEENYATEHYADRYFSHENAAKIGYVRADIERLKVAGTVNKREYAMLLMSLLYAVQRADISRTIGHFMTYLKHPKKDGQLQLRLPLVPSADTNRGNRCYNRDALDLIKILPPVDVLYLDPPYQRQYGEYYHVLESIALWNQEPTFGTTKRIATPKSPFSAKATATEAFAELIRLCQNKGKYILVSYNNDPRNNIQSIDVMSILSQAGKTRVYTVDYPAFHGSKQVADNKERLFFCKIRD